MQGAAAARAWTAVQQGQEVREAQDDDELFWQAGGIISTFVYAGPELRGIADD